MATNGQQIHSTWQVEYVLRSGWCGALVTKMGDQVVSVRPVTPFHHTQQGAMSELKRFVNMARSFKANVRQ